MLSILVVENAQVVCVLIMSSQHLRTTFNSKEDYTTILDSLKQEFEQRWQAQEPSPYTNLESYVQRAVLGNGSFGTVVSHPVPKTCPYLNVSTLNPHMPACSC